MDSTDAQWEFIAPLLPNYRQRKDGRGRPRKDLRDVLNGVLWILRAGAQWADLPDRYPPYQTCHRYFQEWSRDGTLKRMLQLSRKPRGKPKRSFQTIADILSDERRPTRHGDPWSKVSVWRIIKRHESPRLHAL